MKKLFKNYNVRMNVSIYDMLKINKDRAINLITCCYKRQHSMTFIDMPPVDKIKFIIDYPLQKKYIGTIDIAKHSRSTTIFKDGLWFSVGVICWEIVKAYKKIYRTTKTIRCGDYRELSARRKKYYDNQPNPYGIWGHMITDLAISGFRVILKNKKEVWLNLWISS